MLEVRFSNALKAMPLLGHAKEQGSPILSSTQLARS
jgi:Rrf2 family transcriptional repressor of oqxAB